MHRRSFTLPVLLVVAAIAVGACGGNSTSLSDPTEILTKAVEALQNVKTLHMEATVDGTVKADLSGTGAAGDITLTGTKLSADVDVDSGDASLNLAVPAFLGMTADVIVTGGDAYTRVSLISDKYQKTSAADAGLPIDATDPGQGLKDLGDWLKKPEVGPEKLGDTSCGSKTCYQVKIDLTADELATLIPEVTDLSGVGDAQLTLTVLVEQDTLRPASMELKLGATDFGQVTVTLSFSKWDESLTIEAPPADQIE